MKTRGFEVVSAFTDKDINLPKRGSKHSAGYDIESAETVEIKTGESAVLPTGIKAYMQGNEYLAIHIRSSMGIKKGLRLLNSTGIIDSDYYNNASNEGHILVGVKNTSKETVIINKGDRIAQGIFTTYFIADGDDANDERTGGIGSTGINN